MTLKVTVTGTSFAAQFDRSATFHIRRMAQATVQAATLAAQQIEKEGREDMARGGNFGTRWMRSLKATVGTRTGGLFGARITVTHDISYWRVFQIGARIKGKPLLWIPLAYTNVKIRAKDYARLYGGLFMVIRKRDLLPLLLSVRTKKVIYFGKQAVQLKKRFHLLEICGQILRQLPLTYNKAFGGK